MIDFVIGVKQEDAAAIDNLTKALRELPLDGTAYVGYPALSTPDEPIFVEVMLTCEQYGVIIFDILEPQLPGDGNYWSRIQERQDSLYAAMESKLKGHKSLRKGRELAVPISVISFGPALGPQNIDDFDIILADADSLAEHIQALRPMPSGLMTPLNAAIQRVTNIKPPKKRQNVAHESSRGAVMKHIESKIANLDRWQKKAAIEIPNGAQRIRGLAGSGKTVVLALKAAYLHARHPDWTIAVTFYTRSLHQQFKDLIRRFTFEHINDEPDWNRLRILHAWGSRSAPGVYSEMAAAHSIVPLDLTTAKSRYGTTQAFAGACDELLASIGTYPQSIYDAILIDEAQDFPKAFFRLAYASVGEPKRVLWAYDELQNLSEFTMAPPSELFGHDTDGTPLIQLHNEEGQPQQDVILPVSYRNPPWALVTAHALGFGIYREKGLIQFFDEPGLWKDIGYEIKDGDMRPGQEVILQRSGQSVPEYFDAYLSPEDAVQCHVFDSDRAQAKWIAEQININLTQDELEADDILIIGLQPLHLPAQAAPVMRELANYDINTHIAGVTTSVDTLFIEDSVAVAGIYRAKGNEAPMIYILNAEYGSDAPEMIRRRNALFTAITRSRAWVRICGVGSGMEQIKHEVDQVVANQYKLRFKTPTAFELEKMRKIHRDRTPEEKEKAKNVARGLRDVLGKIDDNFDINDLPSELREQLKKLVARDNLED